MGRSDHCTVWGCDNDQRYPEKYVIKEHIAKFDGSLSMRFGLASLNISIFGRR